MEQAEVSFDEKVHASAVQFLLSEQDNETALILLSCTLDLQFIEEDFGREAYSAWLRGPRSSYEVLRERTHPITTRIDAALNAVLPPNIHVSYIVARANFVDVDPNWKARLLDAAQGKEVHNQGTIINKAAPIVWKDLRFRSQSERRIAEALDKIGVLFIPNCLVRLTTAEGRKNKEPDFVVCENGKWGILEVDGEPYHPPTRTTEDHKRDRDFHAQGIRVVQHFDAPDCYRDPDGVVKTFLDLLRKS